MTWIQSVIVDGTQQRPPLLPHADNIASVLPVSRIINLIVLCVQRTSNSDLSICELHNFQLCICILTKLSNKILFSFMRMAMAYMPSKLCVNIVKIISLPVCYWKIGKFLQSKTSGKFSIASEFETTVTEAIVPFILSQFPISYFRLTAHTSLNVFNLCFMPYVCVWNFVDFIIFLVLHLTLCLIVCKRKIN